MQSKIIRIELLDISVVLFHFQDGTKATIVGDTIKGTAKEITYTGGKTYDAAIFWLKKFATLHVLYFEDCLCNFSKCIFLILNIKKIMHYKSPNITYNS